MNEFLQEYTPFLKDAAERAVKTFAGGVLYGLGSPIVDAGFHVALSDLPLRHALDVGLGTTVASLIFSLASIKFGTSGTASLTKAVQKSPQHPKAS